ncbi:hypothetical protein POJ06DRAFT_266080 [Lipomyces tetrasporus]|uniref:U6 snRNA-associated Sm-like protein LSm1 n=1 Tax=Lipomyces tetrasporus TaxID=54092 RepID=A0AAD7VUK0_9ASCO|nr:uncharacterized protein POJ06DRAFT_266080 [Lipomyces tetrasporus]KAJ8103222.1 hypothetical protein POJ06DRAFT_266080 [Lipomyces tetrasporus]
MENTDPALLPSIIFTTAAQLVDCVDKKLLVVLRDGRKLIGILRSFDQYANLVLQDTIERIIVESMYSDIQRGVYIVRGENVVLVGEIEPEKEDSIPLKEVSLDEIYAARQDEINHRRQRELTKNSKLMDIGFSIDTQQEDMY